MVVVIAAGATIAGVAAAIGALPVAILPAPRGHLRRQILVALAGGVMIIAGALLGALPAAATVAGIGVAAYVVAGAMPTSKVGPLGTALLLPFFTAGTGLTVTHALGAGPLMFLGGTWAAVVSARWPRPAGDAAPPARARPQVPPQDYRRYQLGLTAGTLITATVAALISPAHAGWPPTAAAAILRPQRETSRTRAIARGAGTIAGVLVAWLLFVVNHHAGILAAAVWLIGAITVGVQAASPALLPLSITAFALLLLSHSDAGILRHAAGQRLLDTGIAVAVALAITWRLAVLDRRDAPE
ncbi:MAG TPA: FUSC family protein [Solirubrobacteraceae bacterium]|nr:FUSC family protein [Solirubrobacteraceae bacterium]